MKVIRKWWDRRTVLGILAVLAVMVTALPVYGAERTGIQVKIPVGQEFETNSSEADSRFAYELIPEESANPMPEGSSKGVYRFVMEGTEQTELGPILFEKTGIYQYQVSPAEEDKGENYTRDQKSYTVRIYVMNQGQGLSAEVFVLNETGEKCEGMTFKNSYTAAPKPTAAAPAPQQPQKPSTVKTGDASSYPVWMGVFCAAGCGVVLTYAAGFRKRRR